MVAHGTDIDVGKQVPVVVALALGVTYWLPCGSPVQLPRGAVAAFYTNSRLLQIPTLRTCRGNHQPPLVGGDTGRRVQLVRTLLTPAKQSRCVSR